MKYIYKTIALSSLALISSSCKAKSTNDNNKLNVIFIAVDDLKPTLGCYGDSLVKTPNIDRLAAMGTVFENTYCQQAISGATRSSLLTGLRPDRTGVYNLTTKIRDINPDVITLPEHFKNEGYITTGIGKIFHHTNVIDEDNAHSWSIPYSDLSNYFDSRYGLPVGKGYQDPNTKILYDKFEKEAEKKGLKGNDKVSYIKKQIMPSTECFDLPDNAYVDGAVTSKAIEQLKELAGNEKPFFLAIGYVKPHLPFTAPKKYWDMYNREDIPLAAFRENSLLTPDLAYHSCGELRQYTDIPEHSSYSKQKNGLYVDIDKQKELIHGYYACVSYLDEQVGKVLKTIEELNLLDNTVIVLWGDHGWHLGDHNLWNKHTNFENATKVPLIIASPKIKSGRAKTLAEFIDIYPTLCDLTDITIPQNIDGETLEPAMKNNNKLIHKYAVSQYPRKKIMGYSIRTENHRYTLWTDNFTSIDNYDKKNVYAEELYDYQADPLETRNHINEKSQTKVLQKMREYMFDFYKSSKKIKYDNNPSAQ